MTHPWPFLVCHDPSVALLCSDSYSPIHQKRVRAPRTKLRPRTIFPTSHPTNPPPSIPRSPPHHTPLATAAQELDVQDIRLQELIRGSMPDRPPSSSSSRVPPLSDDEIGRFHCAVCLEPKLVFDRFRATAACAHEFCVACVVAHIEARVADGAVPVPCPAAGCPGAMHPEACKKLLDMDVFDAWCVALCERALGPGRARCPYRDCGQLVVLDAGCGTAVGAASGAATCPGCSRAFCLLCEEPWDERHGGGQGCALDRLAAGRNWMRCPSCRAMIDRIDGCKSMLCRCGSVFCYGCGSSPAEGMC